MSRLVKKGALFFLAVALIWCVASCSAIDKMIYPIEYEELIREYGDLNGIPYEILAAVIKTESGFDPYARSSAGAVGLMQLLPSTAEEMASRMGAVYDAAALTNPETNVAYGSYYLKYLYVNLGENWDTACAAYNAGIGKVSRWLEDERYSDDGVSLKEIPITETEKYVERINKYSQKYKKLYFSKGE